MKKRKNAEEFVKIWQTSETLELAAKRSGLKTNLAAQRACGLRKLGVPLKKFVSLRPKLDIAKLTALAESLNQQ